MKRLLNIEKQMSAMHTNDQSTLIELDNEFHKHMFTITGQLLSWQVLKDVSNHYSRIRQLSVNDSNIMNETILQHQKILSAIYERNSEYAKVCIKAHLHQLEGQIQHILQTYPEYFEQSLIPDKERFAALLAQ